MNENKNLACLMVTYNRSYLLDQILFKIQKFSWSYSRFVIVDNFSTDETTDILGEYEKPLRLEILTLGENIGHCAGLAQGLRFLKKSGVRPEYVVFLEDDSFPKPDYLNFLTQAITNDSFTLISSIGYRVGLGKRIQVNPKPEEIQEADFGIFDGAIARFEDLLMVGYPVENWFMMFDDFEYCHRIKKAGFKIGIINNPHLEIMHLGLGEAKSHSHLWRTYFQSRNFTLFMKKYFTLFIFLDWLILQSKRLLGGIFLKDGLIVLKMTFLGIRAGILGKTGKSLNLKTLKES